MNLDKNIIDFLNNKLFLDSFLDEEHLIDFYLRIDKYLKNRSSVKTFFNNVDETISFLEKIGLDYNQIILCIYNWPSIIHADKKDLFNKYLLIIKPLHYGLGDYDRDDILINHPKDFMTGIDTLYARIEFFLSPSSNDVTRKEMITRRKLFKVTHSEFELMYNIKKDVLLSMYPLTDDIIKSIMEYDENKEVVGRFYGDSKGFGRRTS